MKNKIAIFLLLLSICFFSGCVKLYFALTGAHEPRVEVKESITKQLIKHDLDTAGAIVLKEDQVIPSIFTAVNECLLFDKNGFSIDFNSQAEDPSCGGNILGVIEGIGAVTYYPRDSNKTYLSESSKWKYLNSREDYIEMDGDSTDYFVVYYWNTFAGRSHIKFIDEIEKRVKNNPRVKIKFLYVNQDMISGPDYEAKLKDYRAKRAEGQSKQ